MRKKALFNRLNESLEVKILKEDGTEDSVLFKAKELRHDVSPEQVLNKHAIGVWLHVRTVEVQAEKKVENRNLTKSVKKSSCTETPRYKEKQEEIYEGDSVRPASETIDGD